MEIKLTELAENAIVMENLRMDLTPEDIFKPRFASHDNFEEGKASTQGFFFYVEITENGPELMLMKNYDLKSKTVGEVTGIPMEHLHRVVTNSQAREVSGMFPIDEELKSWIKGQLGL